MKTCIVIRAFTYRGCNVAPLQRMYLKDHEAESLQEQGKVKILDKPENRQLK